MDFYRSYKVELGLSDSAAAGAAAAAAALSSAKTGAQSQSAVDNYVRYICTVPQRAWACYNKWVNAAVWQSLTDKNRNDLVNAAAYWKAVVEAGLATDISAYISRNGGEAHTQDVEEILVAMVRCTRDDAHYAVDFVQPEMLRKRTIETWVERAIVYAIASTGNKIEWHGETPAEVRQCMDDLDNCPF